MHNYLLEYSSFLLLNKEIKSIIESIKFNDYEYYNYDVEEDSFNKILEFLDTYSLFNSNKVIVVRNIDLLEYDSKDYRLLIKYLDNSSLNNLLILVSDKVDSRKKTFNELKSKTEYKKIEADSFKIIKELLEGYTLESGVINKIINYTNDNIDAISNECNKLMLYKLDDKKISNKDVEDVCIKKLVDSNNIIFDLVSYISKKDKRNSLITYNLLKEYSIDDIAIIGLLESQLRLIEEVIAYKNINYKKDDIAKELEIHPFRVEKALEILSYVNKSDIDKLIINLSNLDYNYKSGIELNNNFLELFLINI